MFLSKITTHSWQYHRTTEHEESTSTRTTGRLLLLIVPHDEDLGERGRQRHLLDDLVQAVEPVVREDDGREALHPRRGVGHRQRVARRHLAAQIDIVLVSSGDTRVGQQGDATKRHGARRGHDV